MDSLEARDGPRFDGLNLGATPASVEELIQLLIDRTHEGFCIEVETLVRSFPQWADELRDLLPVLQRFRDSRAGLCEETQDRFDSERGRRIANYEISRVIGRGGMGVVYEANQTPLGRRVAIKLLKEIEPTPTARQRFEREFRIAANLHHTNIVPVFDAGEDNHQLFFAMQLIAGVRVTDWAAARIVRSASETNTTLGDSNTLAEVTPLSSVPELRDPAVSSVDPMAASAFNGQAVVPGGDATGDLSHPDRNYFAADCSSNGKCCPSGRLRASAGCAASRHQASQYTRG